MSIYEYDREKHIQQERADAWEEGWKEGRERGRIKYRITLIQKKIQKGLDEFAIADAIEVDPAEIHELYQLVYENISLDVSSILKLWENGREE